jgi:hypothetical protein
MDYAPVERRVTLKYTFKLPFRTANKNIFRDFKLPPQSS